MGFAPTWIADETPVFGGEDRNLLEAICARMGLSGPMVAKLLDVERESHAMSRRSAVHQKIAAVLDEDWRSKDEIASSEAVEIDDPE